MTRYTEYSGTHLKDVRKFIGAMAKCLFLAGVATTAGRASAQSVEASTSVAPQSEIVVTATKRAERLQDVPISLTAITGADLERGGIANVADLQGRVPNLGLGDSTGTPTIYIRGIGGGGRNAGFDPRVGVYIDGVYNGNTAGLDSALLDLERVEVLRGPQGFLFGENTDAGAISLVTAAPANDFSLKAGMTFGNKAAVSASGVVNLPIDDKLAIRASIVRSLRDGFTYNTVTNRDVDDLNDLASRVRLRYRPTETLTFDLAGDYTRQLTHLVVGEARTDPFGLTPTTDGPFVIAQGPERNLDRNWGTSLTGDWKGDGLTVTSITAYRKSYRRWQTDADHSTLDLLSVDYRDYFRTFSQELRAASTESGPFRYLLGLYYSSTSNRSNRAVIFGADASPLFGTRPGAPTFVRPRVDSVTYAAYASLDYAFAPALTLNVGGRLQRLTRHLTLSQDGSAVSPPLTNPTFSNYREPLGETTVSPTVGLTWKPSPHVMVYAKYARGYKGGGFNADAVSTPITAPLRFSKEQADTGEIGTKLDLLDRRLQIDASFFYARYRNYQVQQFTVRNDGTVVLTIVSAGGVESYGPELEATLAPVQGLRLAGSVSYLEAHYSNFQNGGGLGINYTDNRLEYAPRITASISADYETKSFWSDQRKLFAGIHYSYRDRQYTTSANVRPFLIDHYSLVDAQLGVKAANGAWSVMGFAKNLTDERYDESLGLDGFGTVVGFRGLPRTYGLSLSVAF